VTAVNPWPPDGWAARTWRPDATGRSSSSRPHHYYVVDRHPGAPSVLLMHEFPGISEHLVHFAEELAEDFRVVVPSVVGRDGDPGLTRSAVELCVRREVELLRTGRESRAVPWLRGLLDQVVAADGRPCGVVGMCMTGGFALALAVHPAVRAAVVAQPAVPPYQVLKVPLPGRDRRAADLGLTQERTQELTDRVTSDPGCLRVRGYRFDRDEISPPERLQAAKEMLGDVMEARCLPSPTPKAHSTLTGPARDTGAVGEVRAFLRERLGVG
jgi:dienelactone hydrolase